MKIKRLEVCGFKSFVDKTVVNFDHDVLAIVGPNGCGKSNIVDAIRWCMGEQSAKHLRGRSMEDVIFSGSESRGGSDFAEVTLTFENDDPSDVPLEYKDYTDIAVTRKLHRSGDSEYLINKTQVRLKDVTDLFLGTGVGTKAYSIVEQGKIGLIVSAKPEDRRILIEEAAGITKFKSKKKQAERKMELTQQNLLRIGDIVTEIERNLGSLKRQAAKAERYIAYRSELEDVQLYEASHRYLEHVGWIKLERGNVEALTLRGDEAKHSLLLKETELETLRLEAHAAEQVLEEATNAHYAQTNAVRAEEGAIERARDRLSGLRARESQIVTEIAEMQGQHDLLLQEREGFEGEVVRAESAEQGGTEALTREAEILAELEAGLREAEAEVQELRQKETQAQKDISSCEARLDGFDRRRDDMDARLDRVRFDLEDQGISETELRARKKRLGSDVEELRAGKMTTAEERARLEERLVAYRQEILGAERDLEEAKSDHQTSRSRLTALLEIQARLDGVGNGVRALVADGDPAILGLVADRIEAPAEYTQALAALLGERLQEVVVGDVEKGRALLLGLAESSRGRATITPAFPRFVAGQSGGPGGVRLFDVLRFAPEDEALVHSLVGDCRVVFDETEAAQLCATLGVPVVTHAGTVFHTDGRIAGGAGDALAAGMLETKREARELGERVEILERLVTERLGVYQTLRAGISDVQTALERARQEAHQGELALVTAEGDLKTTDNDLEKVGRRLEQLRQDAERLTADLATAETEREAAERTLQQAKETLEMVLAEVQGKNERAELERLRVNTQRERSTQMKVDLAGFREKLFAARGALSRIGRSVDELSDRKKRLDDELDASAAQFGEAVAQTFVHRERLEEALDGARAAEIALTAARQAAGALREELSGREGGLKDLRTTVDASREALAKHELTLREHTIALDHLLGSVREKFRGLELNRIIGDYHMRPPPDAETRSRIGELATLIERMGSVNLEAMREHKEAEERFEYYSTQKADLDRAMADLERAIQQMNKESKRLFKDTFDAVNIRFQEIFPKMFRGGRASLRLTNPEDMLETGIDILAQPPGKKLSSIELMSGGEKALTAVSLIFAIFQIKPSPFCILDEVDAPLDEANVARYNEMIREMTDRSQFILITHIKRTMQMVDVLYGVTMQEPGVSRLVSVKMSETAEKRRSVPKPNEVAVA